MKKEDKILCPYCGKVIKKDFQVCPYCRKEIKIDKVKEVANKMQIIGIILTIFITIPILIVLCTVLK